MQKVNKTDQQDQVNQSRPLATERGETLRAAQGDGQSCVLFSERGFHDWRWVGWPLSVDVCTERWCETCGLQQIPINGEWVSHRANRVDHHEVKVYYDGEPVAVASGPTPCAVLMSNLLTEMVCKGLAARAALAKVNAPERNTET